MSTHVGPIKLSMRRGFVAINSDGLPVEVDELLDRPREPEDAPYIRFSDMLHRDGT